MAWKSWTSTGLSAAFQPIYDRHHRRAVNAQRRSQVALAQALVVVDQGQDAELSRSQVERRHGGLEILEDLELGPSQIVADQARQNAEVDLCPPAAPQSAGVVGIGFCHGKTFDWIGSMGLAGSQL